MAKVTIDKNYQRSRDVLGALNAYKPDFYRVAIDGKSSLIAFPDDAAKAYYKKCFAISESGLPIEIHAYTVLNSRAYFVVASWDQTAISLKRFFMAANAVYAKYFNERFGGAGGYVFKSKIRLKKISGYEGVLESIVAVHSQPAANGLSAGFDDYEFTSYTEAPGKGISSLESLYKMLGKDKVRGDYVALHSRGPSALPQDFFNLPEKENFELDLEKVLLNYRCLDRVSIPHEILYRVIIDLNEAGGYTFDYILDELNLKRRERYPLLLSAATGLALDKKKTYDEILSLLDVVPEDDRLIKDIVYSINRDKGYSYDYIMKMLGLAYPNTEFLLSFLNLSEKHLGISYIEMLKKLGIYDSELIAEVTARFPRVN